MTATAYPRILLFLPLLFLAVSALNACGNKGALYIPPPPLEQQSETTSTAPEDNNE